MAHLTTGDGYRRFSSRLNLFPQGAPPSPLLHRILALLCSEEEAGLLALLPVRPFTLGKAARAWKMKESRARKILDELCGRALLLDLATEDGGRSYVLPPPMAGFFEFSLMRVRGDIDQQALAELFYQYLNVEDDFIKALFLSGPTSLGRVFVHEPALPPEISLSIMDYEKASAVIGGARHIAVGLCYCRHKMAHVGRDCEAPKEICMTFGFAADAIIRHGFARRVEAAEALDLLAAAHALNLLQCGENVRREVSFICHCCGCCCEGLIAARKFGHLHPVWTTNYLPEIDASACTGCGRCVDVCPVEAVRLASANDPRLPKRKVARLDPAICLGCGVCVRNCPAEGAARLVPRPERVITPLDSVHRTVVMAIERGRLQHLIFDNQALLRHRAMAAILGVILRLPPVKQLLASRQLQSRYLEQLLERRGKLFGWEGVGEQAELPASTANFSSTPEEP